MDEQTQSFLELTAKNDLVQLAADKRAAWLWSADGARILWANAAGAAFFASRSVSDLKGLTALERSPARPHIARIAEAGAPDRFSIDRLRFYRGLRVMLLTCQCKRLELDSGEAAALIVCGDKGLALGRDPVAAFAQLIADEDATVFVTERGTVADRFGELSGTPEDLDLPDGQNILFGPLELDGRFHEGTVLLLPDHRKLVVLENELLPESDPAPHETDTEEPEATPAADTGLASVGVAAAVAPDDGADTAEGAGPDADAGWIRADADEDDDVADKTNASEATQATERQPAGGEEATAASASTNVSEPSAAADIEASGGDAVSEAEQAAPQEEEERDANLPEDAPAADVSRHEEGSTRETGEAETTDEAPAGDEPAAEADSAEKRDEETDPSADGEGFTFQPRRRPVRFAWKMDIDQRFTFISDEFADVLGPVATDIVGLTWEEVSDRFDLDPRGQIARALDRRDTWSGKTVNWPVSGAALRVPVDLAALPAFDRHRKFEGYRGFGVCRTADAIPAPDGLMLSPALAAFDRGVTSPLDEETAEAAAAEDAEQEALAAEGADTAGRMHADADSVTEDGVAPEGLAADPIAAEPEDTSASDAADAAEHGTEDADMAADDGGTDEKEAPADAEPEKAAAPEASLDDLKPAKPDSFAGKTFLGASAAALVGSLAKFTGKSAQRASDKTEKPAERQEPEPVARTEEPAPKDEAASAIERSEQTEELATDKDMDGLPGAALDDKLQALEAGGLETQAPDERKDETEETGDSEREAFAETDDVEEQGEPEEAGEPAESLAESGEEAEAETATDDHAGADEEERDLTGPEAETGLVGEAPSEAEEIADDVAADHAAAEEPEAEAGTETEKVAETAPVREPVPTGIAGPAPLKPAEIESAVKSLAKTYKENEKKARDLFDRPAEDEAEEGAFEEDLEEIAASDREESDTAETPGAPADETGSADGAVDDDAELADADAAAEEDEDLFEPVPAFEDTQFDLVEPEDREIEAAAEELAEAEENAGDVSDDERDFFEETAAFESEDKAAEADDDVAPPAPKTGEVIPLATVKPRLVPVDTSGLSRPERQAFRKIAEALGARLEGDLADFDAPDPEQPPEEELPAEVPEAGPIDPSLLDRLPIGIAIAHDREVLYANKALIRMLGYKSVSALAEAGGLEALFIDDTEELPDADGMDGEVDETMKLRLADGGVLNVDAHMHSVPWNGNRGLMISITERKVKPVPPGAAPASPNFFAEIRAELDSARSQIAEMDTILETATDGVLVLDQHGTIIKVNGSAEALFSANRADMIGSPLTDFLAPESHRAAADYLDGLTRNGVASILNDGREVLGKVPAGGLIPLFMTIGRISGGKDDAKYCAVLRDITQWKTAEEELTQAKRQAENASSQKSDFLAKISHEIRTPLNAIIGFSEVMMEERFGPIGNDRYKDYLKDIRTSGSHIMSLINDLLDLSKIEAGKLDLKFSAVSTNDVISECVALMQPQANRERVIIRASLPESVPNVVADPRSLRQIVLNLLSNAIKYNKSGGQVILSTALESNGEVALRVRDTGTGMTAKQLAAALEPFRQLHTASRGGGTGLGLPLTKALVEANRASFHIDSTPDQGTLVEIVFPTQRVLSE